MSVPEPRQNAKCKVHFIDLRVQKKRVAGGFGTGGRRRLGVRFDGVIGVGRFGARRRMGGVR